MIVRLLLALLLASFALPAAATVPASGPSCHEPPMAGMTHHAAFDSHAPNDRLPDRQAPAHVCAGCVPLPDWLGTRIAARILPAPRQPDARVARLDLGGAVAPALPPPRRA